MRSHERVCNWPLSVPCVTYLYRACVYSVHCGSCVCCVSSTVWRVLLSATVSDRYYTSRCMLSCVCVYICGPTPVWCCNDSGGGGGSTAGHARRVMIESTHAVTRPAQAVSYAIHCQRHKQTHTACDCSYLLLLAAAVTAGGGPQSFSFFIGCCAM